MFRNSFLKFNDNFFLIFTNYLILLKFFYFNISFIENNSMIDLLKFIEINKQQLLQKEKKFFNISEFLVKEGRVKKECLNEDLNFLNISEFVSQIQKEIYLKNNFRRTYFLKNNLIIQKNFFFNKRYYFLKLDKIFYNYFLKIKNLGNFFFIQYRVYGLGFRIKYSSLNNSRSLCFEIGYGHGIYYILPLEVKCLKRKRRFLIFSNDLQILNYTKMHIDNLKLLNPYKIRGLKDLKYEIKMKKGKKQSKK
jgi:hypothetical protein